MQKFTLNISTNAKQKLVELKLFNQHQVFLASQQIRLDDHPPSQWESLFDTRTYINRYANNLQLGSTTAPVTQQELLTRLGVFLGEKVLGQDIMRQLSLSRRHRTLVIHIPDSQEDVLGATFIRIPWEMARLKNDKRTLFENNLVVSIVPAEILSIEEVSPKNKTIRILLVFAEAGNTNPLAMRLERERLLALFEQDILPYYKVEIDFLCHGVTRQTIENQIRKRGGYEIVHWSGHGHHNTLELSDTEGMSDKITGEELVNIFMNAGGFTPKLIFLSACHSGSFLQVSDWDTLKSILDHKTNTKEVPPKPQLDKILNDKKGYTGTAVELIQSEIPQVIAMRYAVGDAYARRLAKRFYQHLLADPAQHSVDSALALARNELFRDQRSTEHPAIDHATPILFGEAQQQFQPEMIRSAQLKHWQAQPQPLLAGRNDLDPPWGFVGRNEELNRLALKWLPQQRNHSPLAVIQGMAGLGKTALAAEFINIWHRQFDWVFAFQTRPDAMTADAFYQGLDDKFIFNSTLYHEHCQQHPNARLYLSNDEYQGEQRYQIMRHNLVRALRSERILIVLDNFETQLNPHEDATGYRCKDPEWEQLLKHLGGMKNTASRMLLTSRYFPVCLKKKALWISLGPLPMSSLVQMFLQGHNDLRNLWYHGDTETKDLVLRVFEVSRGHPLILERLGNLAADPQELRKVLDEIDATGYQHLPKAFSQASNDQQRKDEQAYLEDVIEGAIKKLIEKSTPNARRLLWIITLASEAVPWLILDNVWRNAWLGDDYYIQEAASLETLRELVGKLSLKPQQEVLPLLETQERFVIASDIVAQQFALAPKVRQQLQQAGYIVGVPKLAPLLDELIEKGLLQQHGETEEAEYSFHEVVKEQCMSWVEHHYDDFSSPWKA